MWIAALVIPECLDPTSLPGIVMLYQNHGLVLLDIVFYMVRTYAYGLHRKKLILLGKWPYAKKDTKYNKNRTVSFCVAGTIARRPVGYCVTLSHTTRPEHPIVCQVPFPSPPGPTIYSPGVSVIHHHTPGHTELVNDIPAGTVMCTGCDSELECGGI